MAKKTTSSKGSRTRQSRSSTKRDLVRGPQASSYTKRTAKGRFKEMDDVGRSQQADKPRKAKRAVQSGYGDQGDQQPRGRAAKGKQSRPASPRASARADEEAGRKRSMPGWQGSAKAYAALGLAKGLRAAARTISLARGQGSSPRKS